MPSRGWPRRPRRPQRSQNRLRARALPHASRRSASKCTGPSRRYDSGSGIMPDDIDARPSRDYVTGAKTRSSYAGACGLCCHNRLIQPIRAKRSTASASTIVVGIITASRRSSPARLDRRVCSGRAIYLLNSSVEGMSPLGSPFNMSAVYWKLSVRPSAALI